MKMLSVTRFSYQAEPMTPLPTGPEFWLPSGCLEVQDDGRLYSFGSRWVIAVGLSSKVFLVPRKRATAWMPPELFHELLGYLTACGAYLIWVDYRFPLAWRQGSFFGHARELWVAKFFEECAQVLFRVPLPLSEQALILLPLAAIAGAAHRMWLDIGQVADALLAEDESAESRWRQTLWKLSATWERRWNQFIAQIQESGSFEEDDWPQVHRCDRAWADVVRQHLEPYGYIISPGNTARLL